MGTDAANRSQRGRFVAAGAIAGVLALAAAGCASSGNSASASPPAPSRSHEMTEPMAFGPDCGMVPRTGMGSFHSMSMEPVITAASHNPLLTAFAADAKKAGLASDLDSMHAVTVFAPANSAFSKLSDTDMTMMDNTKELAKILKYGVVNGRVTPSGLAHGMTLTTLEGGTLKGAKMGGSYEVGNASVLCGGIQTENATIYVISKVLIPMH